MENSSNNLTPLNLLKWTARVSSLLTIFLVLLVFLATLTWGDDTVWNFTINLFTVIFFPIGICVGLGLAIYKSLAGSMIAIMSIICLHIVIYVQNGFISFLPFVDITIIPAIMYFIYGILGQKKD